jgi:glycosyltransferase involved in cell wall biosynthesis
MPFFSIIITVYNKEAHIEVTLNSVLTQTFQDFEIIVINDGSTDTSLEIVSTFKDKRIQIINKKNEGASSARNLGIKTSQGNYIALLDGDDIWSPDHLTNLNKLIASNPNCGLYCTAYETFYYNKKIVKANFLGIVDDFSGIVSDYFLHSLIDGIALTSAVVIPKQIIERYGNFNPHFRSGQDTDLWIRIALKETIAFTSKISVRRIISSSNNHLSLSDKRIDRLKVLEQFKGVEKTNESLKKYMDIIRFSIAIERKVNGDIENYEELIKAIDYANLNTKQKLLLKLPPFIIKKMKLIQVFLIKNKVYLSPFR